MPVSADACVGVYEIGSAARHPDSIAELAAIPVSGVSVSECGSVACVTLPAPVHDVSGHESS